MKAEHENYLKAIGLTPTAIGRVEFLLKELELVIEHDALDIFVIDSYDETNVRRYHYLWIFAADFLTEFKDFMAKVDFDFVPHKGPLYVAITYENLSLGQESDKSRMALQVLWSTNLRAELRACGNNCGYLRKIVQRYFLQRDPVNG